MALSGSTKASEVRAASLSNAVQYHLRLHHLHTGEDIDVVYRVGDTYLPAALEKLNYFLRDHRTQTESAVRSEGVRPASCADGSAGAAEWGDRYRLRLPDAVEQQSSAKRLGHQRCGGA